MFLTPLEHEHAVCTTGKPVLDLKLDDVVRLTDVDCFLAADILCPGILTKKGYQGEALQMHHLVVRCCPCVLMCACMLCWLTPWM